MSDAPGPGALLVALNDLRKLSTGELREKYSEVFGEATSSRNRAYLLRKIAAEMRCARDAVSNAPDDARAVESPPAARPERARRAAGGRDPRIPPPGTVLERAHEGGVVRVTVLENGFEYDGATYGSLSAVARAATGTRWDGLLFFRLKAYSKHA